MRKLNPGQMEELKALLASLEIHTLTAVHRYVTGLYQVANNSTLKRKVKDAPKSNTT